MPYSISKLLNCKIIKKNEIVCYLVTDFDPSQSDWEEDMRAILGNEFEIHANMLELRPYS